MNVAVMKTKAEAALGEQFEAVVARLPGTGWVKDLRKKAIGAFEALGLPHRRIEEWKYTDLREKLREALPPAVAARGEVSLAQLEAGLGPQLAGLDSDRLVFVDGAFRPDLSRSDGLAAVAKLTTLGEALAQDSAWLPAELDAVPRAGNDSLRALNTAFMTDGVALRVAAGKAPKRPVMLVFARSDAAAAAVTTRNLVKIEDDARLTLIEVHVALTGAQPRHQANAVTDIAVGARAKVAHIKCASDASEAAHLCTWTVGIGEGAVYDAFHLTAGLGLARNQVFATFAGEGAKADISGVFLGRGSDHIDTTLVVDHAVPACHSRELFKGVLDGRARGVFQGKAVVRPNAQKTDGKQMAQALMLSEDAEFDSKPELEIHADDVVCGHGSTCAEIDPDMLFYLQSRGIPKDEARALLIESFVVEAIDKIEDENIRGALMGIAHRWLAAA